MDHTILKGEGYYHRAGHNIFFTNHTLFYRLKPGSKSKGIEEKKDTYDISSHWNMLQSF